VGIRDLVIDNFSVSRKPSTTWEQDGEFSSWNTSCDPRRHVSIITAKYAAETTCYGKARTICFSSVLVYSHVDNFELTNQSNEDYNGWRRRYLRRETLWLNKTRICYRWGLGDVHVGNAIRRPRSVRLTRSNALQRPQVASTVIRRYQGHGYTGSTDRKSLYPLHILSNL